nr:hypothetical protein [uncultured Cupriavidus sp.]
MQHFSTRSRRPWVKAAYARLAGSGGDISCFMEYRLGERMKIIARPGCDARQLVITAHGEYAPWSGEAVVPAGTVVKFLNPHDTLLRDPGLRELAGSRDISFASVASTYVRQHKPMANQEAARWNLAALAGCATPGRVRNYRLFKYEDDDLNAIARALDFNRQLCESGIGTACDFLTIRNRRSLAAQVTDVTLRDVFRELATNDLHYDTIVCSFCRAPTFGSAKAYDAHKRGFV